MHVARIAGLAGLLFLLSQASFGQPHSVALTDFVTGAEDLGHTRVAAAADGSVAMAVEVRHSGNWKVAVQRYSPAIQPVGPLHLFEGCGIMWTSEFAELPELSFHPTGHLIVLFQQTGDYHLAGDSWASSEVHIGLIDPNGNRIDTAPGSSACMETFLYFDTGGRQDRPRMAFTPTGELFATADGFFGSTNYRNVAFMVMDNELNQIEELQQVVPHADELSAEALHWYPDIATNGSVLISTWHQCPFIDNQGNYNECDIGAQFATVSSAGLTALGGNQRVNVGDPIGTNNVLASAAMDAAGNSIVVWIDSRTVPHGAVFGQRFNASGQPVGSNFQISSGQQPFPSTEQVGFLYIRPEVAMLSDGRFMATWTEVVDGVAAAVGRRYSSAGVPLEPPSALDPSGLPTAFPHVEAAGDDYALTWIGEVDSEATLFLTTVAEPVSRDDVDGVIPLDYVLEANYPNPFNPTTTIPFQLPEPTHARLTVHDLLGRRVATLIDGIRPAGRHEAAFDAADLPSGHYLYRLETGRFSSVGRATLLR